MEKTQIEKYQECEFNTIFAETVENMKRLGTYRAEFNPVITRYAELRVQFLVLMQSYYDSGSKVTEEYTNKAGFTNIRKTALYLALESLRKELRDFENDLGLTPAGLGKINDEMKAKKKTSMLSEALKKLET